MLSASADNGRIALFASVNACYLTMFKMGPFFAHHMNWSTPIIVFTASVVVMATAADYLYNDIASDSNRTKWGVAVGTASTFVCFCELVLLYGQAPTAIALAKPLSIFLVDLLLRDDLTWLDVSSVVQLSPTQQRIFPCAELTFEGGHLGARRGSHNEHQRYPPHPALSCPVCVVPAHNKPTSTKLQYSIA